MTALHIVAPENTRQSIDTQAAHLAAHFADECGFRLLPYMAEEMTRYLQDGFAPEMISEAIARTARAPRPSFAYLAAIMRNAKAAKQYDYQSFASSRRRSSAHYSNEREYTAEFWEEWDRENMRELMEGYNAKHG